MSGNEAASAAPMKLSALKPKMKLQGAIKKIELFGAFVDVGAEKDGLVHISQLRKERTNRVEDVLSLGQQVTVWVRKVDTKAGRIDLTMIEPVLHDWDDLRAGLVVKGKVAKLAKFGVFVDIGAERQAFIHVRELTTGHVADPGDMLRPGQEVEAKIIAVDRRKRRIDMSMKALEDTTLEEEPQEEKPATAMELALRQAMQGLPEAAPSSAAKRRKKSKSAKNSAELEAVLQRTLRQHASNN